MTELEVFLDKVFLEIINEEISPKVLREYLDEMTLSYTEVGSVIVPFLEHLSEIGMDGAELGNTTSFFYIGEIVGVFLEKYFYQVKENHYCTNKKTSILTNWFCKECWKFFDLTREQRLSNVICPYCKSSHTHYHSDLVKSLYSYKRN